MANQAEFKTSISVDYYQRMEDYQFPSEEEFDDAMKSLKKYTPESEEGAHFDIIKIAVSHFAEAPFYQKLALLHVQREILTTNKAEKCKIIQKLFCQEMGPPLPPKVKSLVSVGKQLCREYFYGNEDDPDLKPILEDELERFEKSISAYFSPLSQSKHSITFTSQQIKIARCVLSQLTLLFATYNEARDNLDKEVVEKKMRISEEEQEKMLMSQMQKVYFLKKQRQFPAFDIDSTQHTKALYDKVDELLQCFAGYKDHPIYIPFVAYDITRIIVNNLTTYHLAKIIDELYLSEPRIVIEPSKDKEPLDKTFPTLNKPVKAFCDQILLLGNANAILGSCSNFAKYGLDTAAMEVQRYLHLNTLIQALSQFQELFYKEGKLNLPEVEKKNSEEKKAYVNEIQEKFYKTLLKKTLSKVPSGLDAVLDFVTDYKSYSKKTSNELFRCIRSKGFLRLLAAHVIQGLIKSFQEES